MDPQVLGSVLLVSISVFGMVGLALMGLCLFATWLASGVRAETPRGEFPNEYMRRKAAYQR